MAVLALWLDAPVRDIAATTSARAPAISPGAFYASTFPDLQQHEQSLGQWPQDWLLVNFWATWCVPCREEMPILAKLQTKFSQRHLKVIGISADSTAKAANFAQNNQIGYLLLADEARAISFSQRLGNREGALPYSVLVSPGGTLVWTHAGAVDESALDALLAGHLPRDR
ncbi:MAG: TlpA family protein disulfide reductase [Betaproteobacteria bacterium]|nr:TlpA family protein disulfide reductase [Betaproteobacteria bacterium]